jgi:outer membrane protein assembly factor BamA
MARLLHTWLIGLILLAAIGCASEPEKKPYVMPGATDYIVSQLTIRGTKAIDLADLKSGLVTTEDKGWRTSIEWMPLLGAKTSYFNFVEWERDLQRIETYYQSRGYFDAKVVSKNILQDHKTKTVRLTIAIDEGEPADIGTIDIEGIDVSPIDPDGLLSVVPFRPGDKFNEAAYLKAKDEIALQVQRQGYAYAQTRGRVVVNPQSRSVDIVFFVDVGPLCTFGDVTIEGLDTVDRIFVERALSFKKGERFNSDLMQQSQEAIYGLRVFSVVQVVTARELTVFENGESAETGEPSGPVETPVGDAPIAQTLGVTDVLDAAQANAMQRTSLDSVVPIVVRVKENKLWTARVGASVEAEVNRQAVLARLDWSNPNFFGGLRRIEHFNSVGYAWAPTIFTRLNDGYILNSELRFTRPQFIERLTNLKMKLQFERDVYQGYNLFSPRFQIGLERTFWRHLSLEVLYSFSFNRITSVDRSLQLSDEFIQDYVLEYLEQRLRLDFRDNVLNPRKGWMLETSFQEATDYLTLGQSDFLKISAGGQFYFPYDLWIPQVLAFRARVASIYNVGRETGIPIPEKLYAGGVDSMRSFGRQEISFYTQAGEALPVGAQSSLDGSVESRLRLSKNALGVGDFWGVLFVDAASVAREQLFWDTDANDEGMTGISGLTDTLIYGAGLGFFWLTPIGPVRADFAYTLSDLTDDIRFRRCPSFFEECTLDVALPVDQDPIQERISGYSFYIGIGHSF